MTTKTTSTGPTSTSGTPLPPPPTVTSSASTGTPSEEDDFNSTLTSILSESSYETQSVYDTTADLYSETSFATTLLISVYATMLICVILLFTRIIYIAIIRSFNRPLRPNPSFIISSSEGPTCNDS